MEPTLDPGIQAQPTQAAPLKASVSVTDVRPAKSFQSIIDQNADVWPTLKPEQIQKAATTYLDKFVHPLPGFKALDDEQKNNFYTEFNKKYNVGSVSPNFENLPFFDPTPGKQDKLGNYASGVALNVGSVVDPALKTASFGLLDAQKYMSDLAQESYPGIETDPGFLGDAYRNHQNPNLNMVGQALAAAKSTQNLAQTGLGGWAIPAFSGGSNAVNVLQGKATPLQGIGQTAVDSLTSLFPGGKTFLGNVAKQGVGGAIGGGASSVVNDLATGQKIDTGRAMNEARAGAVMGAGMGAGMHLAHARPTGKQAPSRFKYGEFEKAQSVGVHSPGSPKNVRTAQGAQADRLQQGVKGKLNEASRFQTVTEGQTLQARINALKKQYENLSNISNDPKAPPKVANRAKKMQAKILELHNRLSQEHQQKHGKVKKAGKEPLEHLTKPEDVKALVGLVKEMRSKGNAKQADVAMGKFSRETKAKVYDEVKRQEVNDKTKTTQAKSDNKALNKADAKSQKLENKQLKGDIKERIEPTKTESTPLTRAKSAELKRKDFMPTAKMRQTVKEANAAGESVRIRYRAERTGETGEVEHKTLHDVKIIEGKNGSETKWKGIQVDGQDHHYIERNAKNDMNDSNIISVERTGEKVKYKREVHPETGNAHPVDVETGEFIPQVYKRGVKSSDIRATLSDIVQKINENKRVKVDEVMSAARELEAKTMKENLGDMPAKARTKLYEETTGRPCK